MRWLRYAILWSCAAAALCGCGNPDATPVAGGKSADQPAVTLQSGGVLLDVRSPEEFISGHLRGAVNIPHDRIAEEIAAAVPDKTAQVILYCRSGRRADTALKTMQAMGYGNVSNFGGLEDAQERLGLPVEKD